MKKRRFALGDMPIQQKLVLLVSTVTGAALLVYTLLSIFMQVQLLRSSMVDNLNILADSVASMSTAGLSFGDRDEIDEILSTFNFDPAIELAVIYDRHDQLFGKYQNPAFKEQSLIPEVVEKSVDRFIRQNGSLKLEVFTPVTLGGVQIGTLYVIANSARIERLFYTSLGMMILGMIVILAVAGVAANYLQRLLTMPLLGLAHTARRIARVGDYSMRVERVGNDEVGRFIDDFNHMVRAVEDRDNQLQSYHQNLEDLVRQRTEELREKRDEALAAAQAKTEFLANMSHEIRTPMNGVVGVLSLLHEAPLTEEYRRLLATATRSADSLLLIINDILDFSKIDAGRIIFEEVPFRPRPLIEETAQLFIDNVNAKGIELSCDIASDVPYKLIGDPTRLRQVLTNLISNGIKFTENGEVSISVSCITKGDDAIALRVDVADTGIGIPPEGVERIFDKFVQADGSTERKYGGTGLGLAVCRELVEMQGGSIGVESEVGQGSCFHFILPFRVGEWPLPQLQFKGLEGGHYIVVGDTLTCSRILPSYLEHCLCRVTVCAGREELKNVVGSYLGNGEPIDGIIIDHRLPAFDGPKLVEDMQNLFGNDCPPMLVLSSGSVFSSHVEKLTVLIKPVGQESLYSMLLSLKDGVTGTQAMQKMSALLPRRSRWLTGKVLLVDDEPINQKVLLAILQRFGLMTEVASSGHEALRMVGEKQYDMILMDIQMPGMSGLEATAEIRAREKQEGDEKIPIIAITANALGTTMEKCLQGGMDDFITKPVKPEVLFERLAPWFSTEDRLVIPENRKEESLGSGEGEKVWNPERALEFVGGDNRLLHELIALFLKRYPSLVGAVEKAAIKGDTAKLCDMAHAYKGTVTHFAAEESRQLAYRLEKMGKEGVVTDTERLAAELRQAAERLAAELREYTR